MRELQIIYTRISAIYCFFIICIIIYAIDVFKSKKSRKNKENEENLEKTEIVLKKNIEEFNLNDKFSFSEEIYTAKQLAQYIINKCIKDNHPIDNLCLNQILYMIQITFIKYKDKPAFYDEIVAKRFGVMIPSVYYQYCGYGANTITFTSQKDIKEIKDKNNKSTIDMLIDYYRRFEPWNWANTYYLTGNNTAWDVIYDSGRGNERPITIDHIKNFG